MALREAFPADPDTGSSLRSLAILVSVSSKSRRERSERPVERSNRAGDGEVASRTRRAVARHGESPAALFPSQELIAIGHLRVVQPRRRGSIKSDGLASDFSPSSSFFARGSRANSRLRERRQLGRPS